MLDQLKRLGSAAIVAAALGVGLSASAAPAPAQEPAIPTAEPDPPAPGRAPAPHAGVDRDRHRHRRPARRPAHPAGARRVAPFVLGIANVGQAIPSIGILVLLAVTVGIGFDEAIDALVLYAVLPILRNTMVGLRQVDPALA